MLNELNEKQQEAVLYNDGPLLILAGAGSGKTRSITYKINHLIRDLHIAPSHILAMTFSNKAADEIKKRVTSMHAIKPYAMWMGTFHSIGLRMLRAHGEKVGLASGFVIYDSHDQESVMKKCLKDLNMSGDTFKPRSVMSIMDRYKNDGADIQTLKPGPFNYYEVKVFNLLREYQTRLRTNNAIDFGDILTFTKKLLTEHEDVRAYYKNLFDYILIDEFQDTNRVQYDIIKLLVRDSGNICVVGDEDQSIYRWRGACIENILNFKDDYQNARVVKLEQNYRSTKTILEASTRVIAKNTERLGKTLWTKNGDGDRIIGFNAMDDRLEAGYVVKKISTLLSSGACRRKDIAVFYRTNAQSRLFEEALTRYKIPYNLVGSYAFYERTEIKDMLAYLKFIVNTADSVALKRIINVPVRGIGKKTITTLEDEMAKTNRPMWDVIDGVLESGVLGALGKKLKLFYGQMKLFMDKNETASPLEMIKLIFNETGYLAMLRKEQADVADSRIDNINEFVNSIDDFCKTEEQPTLKTFLDRISLYSHHDDIRDTDAVTLMTVHLAKGLEFKTVFMAGMEQGLFPHSKSFESLSQLEEERRLCYVGMTRAMKNLFITYSNVRRSFGLTHYNVMSPFIGDIPAQYIEWDYMDIGSNE